jgi:hypothetical protein
MADVSVANTSAGLSGKTLTCHDVDGATTGLWTFNRGASPPFAVALGAAVVPNLNADKLDGHDSSEFAVAPITTAMLADGSVTIAKLAFPAVVALTDGASVALDAGTRAPVYRLAAAGDRTISAPTNPTDGQKIVIQHVASGGANRTLSLTTGATGAFRFGADITALTATTSGKTDYIGCIYNGTDSRWDVVAVTKGF